MASLNQVSIELQVTGERQTTQALRNLDNSIVKNVQTAQRLERQYADLDRAFNSGKISAQMYAKGVQQLDRAVKQAYVGSSQLEKQVRSTTNAISAQSKANQFAGRRMNAMGMATQQVGYQVGDFLVQVQSGTNAFVAFGQQATQIVGILPLMADSFGVSVGKLIAISSVLGILIPLTTAFAAAIARTGGAGEIFEDLAFAIEPIRPLIDAIANAMSAIANVTIDFANLLVNNLDRIVVTATLVASFFTVKWVAAFVAARIATLSLSAALTVLRGAIVRTGIGALVVGAGELVYQFTRLVKGAGGFGNAMTLLGNVVKDFFDRVTRSASLLAEFLGDMWIPMEAGMTNALANMLSAWGKFVGTISSGMIKIPFLKESGLDLAFEAGTIGQKVDQLRSSADGLNESWSALSGSVATSIRDVWEAPSEAMDKLREAMANADEEGRNIDIRDWFGGAGVSDEDGDGGSGGKGATDRTKDALTELQEKVQSVADTIKDSMSEAFMSMVEGTKSAKDAFRDMARAIIKQLFDILVVQQIVGSFNAQTGVGSGIVGGIMKLFTNANGNAFRSGNVIPFANGGVVGSPTMFPMAGNQTGLMGEAGPEAIMPLKRGKGGKLGVVAEGASQPVVIHQNFNFSANGDDSVKRIIAQEAPKIANLTQKQILDQRSRGGTFKQVFG